MLKPPKKRTFILVPQQEMITKSMYRLDNRALRSLAFNMVRMTCCTVISLPSAGCYSQAARSVFIRQHTQYRSHWKVEKCF